MRTKTTFQSLITYVILAATVLLVQACGQPVAKDQGCPSDTFLANSTDSIAKPDDVTFTGLSFFGARFGGGTVLETPVKFQVNDSTGAPRNNICLIAYTGDTAASPGPFWYTDETYSSLIIGSGPFSARAIVTDDTGVAQVFWSTADLPVADAVSSTTTGSPPTTTFKAGKDKTGRSFIHVSSGSQAAEFSVNWTVQGEPAP